MYEKNLEIMAPTSADEKTQEEESADFETAIAATGFGKFNILLFLVTIPCTFTALAETSALAYVFPAAQCDLNLTFENKGLVNAITYTGMISSCLLWGPITDIFGRRRILITAHFLQAVCVILAMFSTNLLVLLISKYMGGFVLSGATSALCPYLSEFHGTKHRSLVPLTIGFLFAVANICLPLLSWAILTLDINLSIFKGYEFHAWNLFLLICALPPVLIGIVFIFLPETPKYLMTKGNNEQALAVFRKIYKLNTGKSQGSYPIARLVEEKQMSDRKEKTSFKDAWKQISPLFSSKHAAKLFIVCLLELLLMMCHNSLRLWVPQIFQTMSEYRNEHGNGSASFCTMINTMQFSAGNEHEEEEGCSVSLNNNISVYTNAMTVGACTMCAYIAASFVINRLGKKKMFVLMGIISGSCIASLYFVPNSTVALIVICLQNMSSALTIDVMNTIIIDSFPTSLRASGYAMALMCGRTGSVLGNLALPFLLQAGCAPPFFTISAIIIGCVCLSILLPNTDSKALD